MLHYTPFVVCSDCVNQMWNGLWIIVWMSVCVWCVCVWCFTVIVCVCVCVCVCVHEKASWPSDSHQAIIIGWAESQWQRDLPRILMSTAGQHTYTHLACTCSVWSLSYLIFCIRKKTRWTQDGCHMDVLSGCRRAHFTSSGEQTHHSLHMLN